MKVKLTGVFRKFLISYVLILIIPNIAGWVAYRISIAETTSMSVENSIIQLQKSKELLENRMEEVEGFTRQLAINQDINALMRLPYETRSSRVDGISKLEKDIATYSQTNKFLGDFYLYFNNYDLILSPGSVYIRPEHFYTNYHYKGLTYADWKQKLLNTVHRSEVLPLQLYTKKGISTSVISFVQSLPLDHIESPFPATVVVLIDQSQVSSLFTPIQDQYGGWVQIQNAEGQVISALGVDKQTGSMSATATALPEPVTGPVSRFEGDTLLITIQSEKNGWIYTAGIPRAVLMENANKIKEATWKLNGAALLVGLLAGLLLAYRNSAPIHQLMNRFKDISGKEGQAPRNEYDFLHGNITEIITSNKKLESEVREQFPVLRNAFLKRLVDGEFQHLEDAIAAAGQADLTLYGHSGYAALLHINGYVSMNSIDVLNELSTARLILKQQLEASGRPLLLADAGANQVILISLYPSSAEAEGRGQAELGQLMEQVSEVLFQEYKIRMTCAIGEPFTGLLEARRSYEQAKETLAYAEFAATSGLVWHHQLQVESTTYYYPFDVELRLLTKLKNGDGEEAQKMLDDIMEQNICIRELSNEMKKQLIGEIQGTLLKLLDQKAFQESPQFEGIKARIMQIPAAETLEQARSGISEAMLQLCEVIHSNKNEVNHKTVAKINHFLSESYNQTELSLYQVAEHVGYPEKYISTLYKELTGTNMWDYLEQLRMNRASELLKSTSLTIEEVALAVGYNSGHSFRRAFKRVKSVTPSVFRDMP